MQWHQLHVSSYWSRQQRVSPHGDRSGIEVGSRLEPLAPRSPPFRSRPYTSIGTERSVRSFRTLFTRP